LIAAIAETNRVPFDLPEAETELVAGFHTEYSSIKFLLFFNAEYINMITVSMLATTLFLGGWNVPFAEALLGRGSLLFGLVCVLGFFAKIIFFLFLYIWLRGTLPRFRFESVDGLWLEVSTAGRDSEHRDHGHSAVFYDVVKQSETRGVESVAAQFPSDYLDLE
jgi:NADH-quinone oxidoreductase subunit H